MPTPSANGTRHSAQPKSCKFVISVLSHHHQLEQLNYEPVNRSLNTRRVLRSVLLTAVLVRYSDPSWLRWASVTMPILQSDVYRFLGNRVRFFLIEPEYQLGPDFV